MNAVSRLSALAGFVADRFPVDKMNVASMIGKKVVPVHRMSWAYYLGGLTEATETLVCFVLMCLRPAWFPLFAYGFAALCVITLLTRLHAGWRALSAPAGE